MITVIRLFWASYDPAWMSATIDTLKSHVTRRKPWSPAEFSQIFQYVDQQKFAAVTADEKHVRISGPYCSARNWLMLTCLDWCDSMTFVRAGVSCKALSVLKVSTTFFVHSFVTSCGSWTEASRGISCHLFRLIRRRPPSSNLPSLVFLISQLSLGRYSEVRTRFDAHSCCYSMRGISKLFESLRCVLRYLEVFGKILLASRVCGRR